MKKKIIYSSVIILLIMVLSIAFLIWSPSQSVTPSFSVPGEYDWQRYDTEYCRIYYYQDTAFIDLYGDKIDSIYLNVTNLLGHEAMTLETEDDLLPIVLLCGQTYETFQSADAARAGWNGTCVFINIDQMDELKLEGTMTHEFIHAVTLDSKMSQTENIPAWFAEGIAQYYQYYSDERMDRIVSENSFVSWCEIAQGSADWPVSYRADYYTQAASIYLFLIDVYGLDDIHSIFFSRGDFECLLYDVTQVSVEELEQKWQLYMKDKYN